MDCHDFERRWNELLDSRQAHMAGISSELERTLSDHANECPACGGVGARYLLLRQALVAWSSHPIAPVDLVDQVLEAAQRSSSPGWRAPTGARPMRSRWRIVLPLSTAAAAVIAMILVRPAGESRREERVVTENNRALNTALADATSATLDLARSASAPAARISRHVLDTASSQTPETGIEGSDSFAVSVSSYVPSAPDSTAASAMLQQFGDSVASTVGPLSNSARHAFGFLLGPAANKSQSQPLPPAAKGA